MELMHLDRLVQVMPPRTGQDLIKMEIAEIIKANWGRDIKANKSRDHRARNPQYPHQQ